VEYCLGQPGGLSVAPTDNRVSPMNQSRGSRPILVIDCGSDKVNSIKTIVLQCGFGLQIVRLDEVKDVSFADYAGIIISGAPILLTQTNHHAYVELFNFVPSVDCPVLGICFGHQVIGLVYGAKVFRGPECRTHETIQVLQEDRLFQGLDTMLYVDEDHFEGVTLPDQFVLLARSGSYTVEAMKHREKEIYGVQFHPETSNEQGRKIVHNFLDLCNPPILN